MAQLGSLAWGSGSSTLCETFVEAMTGVGWQGTSALDAWMTNVQRQHQDHDYQPGDAIYFGANADNRYYGHVAICVGPDAMVGVGRIGVMRSTISGWPAPFLGWVRYF